MEHPHDFLTEEELAADQWYANQAWTLLAGIFCGLVAHVALRQYHSARVPIDSPMGAVPSSPASALGAQKMVLVVRSDLSMGKGKAAAQCAHAAVACYKRALRDVPTNVQQWEALGQTKVALKVDGEEALRQVHSAARAQGLVTAVIRDAGRTQVEADTVTVLGVGPGPVDVVDQVAGHLKLF